jgi:hypothetical protein
MTHMVELQELHSSLTSATSIQNFLQHRVCLKEQNILIINNYF